MSLRDYFEPTLAAARTGAAWAWEAIYTDLAGAVAGYVSARGASDPEDIVSETFMSVSRDIHRFEGNEDDFRAWVFTIAYRRLTDALRQRGREVPTVSGEAATALASERWTGDVERDAMNAMSLLEVQSLIRHLTDAQRDVLILRVVGDLSVAETAKVMDKSEGAVRVLQNRALNGLRSMVARDHA